MIIEWIHYCTGVSRSMWVNECSGLLCKGFRFSVSPTHQNWSLDSLAKGGGSLINYQIGSLYWLMRKAHLYALAAGVKTIHSKYLKCCICGALHSGNNNQQPAPRSARQQLFYFFFIFSCFKPKQIWHISIEERGPTVPASAQAATLSTQPEATQERPKLKWCGFLLVGEIQ